MARPPGCDHTRRRLNRAPNGHGSDWPARVLAVGRHSVVVQLGTPQPVQREMALHVTVAIAMPANERMDIFVEKLAVLAFAALQR